MSVNFDVGMLVIIYFFFYFGLVVFFSVCVCWVKMGFFLCFVGVVCNNVVWMKGFEEWRCRLVMGRWKV